MKRKITFKPPTLSACARSVLALILFVSLTYSSTSAGVLPNEPGNNPDSIVSVLLFEQLTKEFGLGETRNEVPWPPIWDVPQNNSSWSPHFIIVMLYANPRINDIPISQYDYIGGFYTDDYGELRCGGADPWNDTSNIAVKLFADDLATPEKDGFSFGEQIYFKLFSWTTQNDYDVDTIAFNTSGLYTSSDKWYPLGASQVVNLKSDVDMDFYIAYSANPICMGTTVFLSAEEFIGTGGPYSFNWTSDPPGFTSSLRVPPPTTPLIETTYFLTVDDGLLSSESQLTINIIELPGVMAGQDGSICANNIFNINGSATNYSTTIWTSSGDGTIGNQSLLATTYTPGTQDIQNGSVTLTLTANPINPCVIAATDELQLQVFPLPFVNAGSDLSACDDDAILLQASGQHFSNVVWTTSGDGNFSNPNALVTQYNPGSLDIANGVLLQVCVNAVSPCVANNCDVLSVHWVTPPSCNAPANRTKCENIPVPMAGSASNNNGILWTTQGDGYFVNPSVINTDYVAGPQDREAGGTIATLNALPNSPCTSPATKDVIIILKPLPDVDAGNTDYICQAASLQLNASVDNKQTFFWETLGDGYFTSTTSLTPIYYLGTQDLQNGNFDLILSATPLFPCTLTVSDTLSVEVIDNPTVDIVTPNNQVVCQSNLFTLSANAIFYDEIIWETSGDGNFGDPGSLNTFYTPGPMDIASGQAVTLMLTVMPIAPCQVSDASTINVTFKPVPTILAGNDATVCETGTHSLTGVTALNYAQLNWITSGNGTFSNPNIKNPVYTPGSQDKILGNATLTLTGSAINPCTVFASDQKLLTVIKLPSVNAGADGGVCETGTYQLNGTAGNYSTLLWQTSGNGTFSNNSILSPVYTPGTNEIIAGTVTLTLNTSAINPCTINNSDAVIISIQKEPVINAGNDATVCEGSAHLLNGVTALSYAQLNWTTSGDGTFNNPNAKNPVYFPGNQDKLNGSATLSLNGYPINPCLIAQYDSKVLTIIITPVANAGSDVTSCGPTQLSGSVANYSTIQWTTTGDGSFSNPSIPNPVFTPGPGDLAGSSVVLILAAQPLSPCNNAASDILIYRIDSPQIISDGVIDKELFAGTTLLLEFIAESATQGDYQWYFQGELIDGQNSSTFFISDLDPDDAGYYYCKYANDCGEVISNEALVQVLESNTQQNVLPKGWSGVSSYVMPNDPAMEDVFGAVVDNLVLISDNVGVYWPAQNLNTLNDWSVTSGYKIKMENNTGFNIDGYTRYPPEALTIPNGWSFLPVNSICAINVETFFNQFPNITMIKDMANTGIYWPGFNINTLQMLYPGRAYHLLNNGAPITFVYPKCSLPAMGYKEGHLEIQSPWNEISKSPSTHIFGFEASVLSQFQSGDIIGAFTSDGDCAGILSIDEYDGAQALVAFAKDPLSEANDGFNEGEIVSFRVFRTSTKEEFFIDVSYSAQSLNAGLFANHGVSIIESVELKTSSVNGIDPNDVHINIYPNPTSGRVNIQLMSNQLISGEISIFNINGQLAYSADFTQVVQSAKLNIDLSELVKGLYYLRITSDRFTTIEKIILK